MPHLVILYTANLDREADISGLCRSLCDTLLAQRDESGKQVFPTGGTRVLAYPAAHSAVADGKDDYGFLYMNLRMAKGRSAVVHQQVGEALKAAVGSYLAFNAVASRGVRPIGVTGSYRSPKLPNVPTLMEQGDTAKLVTLEGGLPLMAPAGTPESVLKLLADEAVAWSNTDRAAKLRDTFAIPNKPKNLAETRKDWESEVPVWIKLAVDLGIKLD